jgi:hypothetical protein
MKFMRYAHEPDDLSIPLAPAPTTIRATFLSDWNYPLFSLTPGDGGSYSAREWGEVGQSGIQGLDFR